MPAYRARRRLCKSVWIVLGLLVLPTPALPVLIIAGLMATFLSFAILDG
jgi:hypothetical protein